MTKVLNYFIILVHLALVTGPFFWKRFNEVGDRMQFQIYSALQQSAYTFFHVCKSSERKKKWNDRMMNIAAHYLEIRLIKILAFDQHKPSASTTGILSNFFGIFEFVEFRCRLPNSGADGFSYYLNHFK